MNKISLFSVAADSLFAAICSFLLFFTAVRYYTSDPTLSVICGAGAFFAFGTPAFLYLKRKRGKRILSVGDAKLKQKLCVHLATIPKAEAADLLLPLFDDGFIDGDGNISTPDCIFVPIFKCTALSSDDIACELRKKHSKRTEILCSCASAECMKLADTFGIKVHEADEIFKKLKSINVLPEQFPFAESKKVSALKKLSGAFRRSASPKLFWCGLCLLTFSFFTFFPLYYIISGGCILVLSAACLIFGKRNNG